MLTPIGMPSPLSNAGCRSSCCREGPAAQPGQTQQLGETQPCTQPSLLLPLSLWNGTLEHAGNAARATPAALAKLTPSGPPSLLSDVGRPDSNSPAGSATQPGRLPHLDEAHASGARVCLLGRDGPTPHPTGGMGLRQLKRDDGSGSSPFQETRLLVVPLPISVGVLLPLPCPLGRHIGVEKVAFNVWTPNQETLRVRANPIQSNPSDWVLLGVF